MVGRWDFLFGKPIFMCELLVPWTVYTTIPRDYLIFQGHATWWNKSNTKPTKTTLPPFENSSEDSAMHPRNSKDVRNHWCFCHKHLETSHVKGRVPKDLAKIIEVHQTVLKKCTSISKLQLISIYNYIYIYIYSEKQQPKSKHPTLKWKRMLGKY